MRAREGDVEWVWMFALHQWVYMDNISNMNECVLICVFVWGRETFGCVFSLIMAGPFWCVHLQLTGASCCSYCLFIARLWRPLAKVENSDRLQNYLLTENIELTV